MWIITCPRRFTTRKCTMKCIHAYNEIHSGAVILTVNKYNGWKKMCKNGFKAVFKCPLTREKFSNALLKLIFCRKCIKFGCMIIEKKNASNGTFYFSVSVVKLEFQKISFLAYHFFITLTQKLTRVLILTLFFLILGNLREKRKTLSNFLL